MYGRHTEGGRTLFFNDGKTVSVNLLIDPQGKIVARELLEEDLQAKLAEIFGE